MSIKRFFNLVITLSTAIFALAVIPSTANAVDTMEKKTAADKKFYGIAIEKDSKSLFIIDCSASMGEYADSNKRTTKLDILKTELLNMLSAAQNDKNYGEFAIITFGANTKCYPPMGLYNYRAANIPQLSARGFTPMQKAWTLAAEVIQREKIDTVYFLTDGNPSDSFRVKTLDKLFTKHGISNLKIHCICLGKDRVLMRKIAGKYKGAYKCIR